MDSVKGSLFEMSEFFNKRMDDFQHQLQKTSPTPPNTATLASEFTAFRLFIMSSLETLQRQVELLAREMDRLEMRGRRKILLLHGIPEEKSEDITSVVMTTVANKLKMDKFSTESISRAHRLGQTTSSKPRPLLVKFKDVTLRDKVWFAKTQLKGTGITVSEFLTKSRHSIFMAARQRFGVSKCWTRDGIIHVLAPDGSHHLIECLADLEGISSPANPASSSPSGLAQIVSQTKKASSDKSINVKNTQRCKRIVKK